MQVVFVEICYEPFAEPATSSELATLSREALRRDGRTAPTICFSNFNHIYFGMRQKIMGVGSQRAVAQILLQKVLKLILCRINKSRCKLRVRDSY